jgi:hypothetical protein
VELVVQDIRHKLHARRQPGQYVMPMLETSAKPSHWPG